ncbi:MAG: hypothetical protein H8M99_05480 [Gloeobacteraceae cyanobacterium ES-bin-144]|nr:hypothetical protein [Verrucomicrobiales bacterium]
MKRFLLLILSTLLIFPVIAGEQINLRFLAERAPDSLGEVVLAAGDQLSPPFTLSSEYLGASIPATARKLTLRFKDKAVVLAEISLPENGNAFIVLLIPDPKGGFQPVVINAGDVNFQGGDVYFYNHSHQTMLGYVGTAKFILKPSEGRLLRPVGAKEDTYYDVGFGVRSAEGDRVLRTLRWPVATRSRSYVFFYQNPVKNRIDFRAVDEFVAQPAMAGTQ